ncbi:MAG TPA: protein kinase [Kofleriaceae bacterium]
MPDDPDSLPPTLAPIAATRADHAAAAGAPPPMPAAWRYAIRVEIARGGMGRVLEATDTVLGREVAVKEALSLDPEALRRFQREVRITAKLEHPSIVPVHDAGTTPDGAPFYVMRKISGRPLEELVALHAELEPRLALVPHIVAAAHAIAHAHERGIVHRDIKPANILVGELGETIVIDWGLAKAMGEAEDPHAQPRRAAAAIADEDDGLKTRAGLVFGTPGFMAPEQLRGGAADERSDVYALGATLYHLLARRPPHYAKTGAEMMTAAVQGPAEPLRALVAGVPPELATIVDKALAHDARARYPNAKELAEDLQRFLTGQLVASHHYSRVERLARFVRRNRALVAVTTAAVLAIAIGGTLAIHRIVDARDRADAEARVALDEKGVAEDGLRKLTLTTARGEADLDPTRAVAMVVSLEPAWWRQVRAIGAAARRHGIAYGVPASPHTLSLEASRDGQRVLAAGDDGVVRLVELAKHTAREVVDVKAPAQARFADGERAIVVVHANHVTLVEVATGARRELDAPTAIAEVEVSGPFAYWIDAAHALWRLDIAGGQPERVDTVTDPAQALAASPDGRWIAVATAQHLLVLDRTQPTLPSQELTPGVAHALSWSADSAYLVALVDRDVVAFSMPSGQTFHRQFAGDRYAVAFANEQIFTTAQLGVSIVLPHGDPRARKISGDYTLGLHEARGGTVVTANRQGDIAVIGADDDELVHAPVPRVDRLATSPRSPWLVAAVDGRLLVWNLDAIQPRRLGRATTSAAAFASGDALVLTDSDQPAQWIDLRDGSSHELGQVREGLRALVPAPDGASALLVDVSHHAQLVAPGAAPRDVADDVELAAFGDRGLAYATSTELHVGSGSVPGPPAACVALAARGAWIAAAYAGRLVRTNPATHANASLTVQGAPTRGALAVAGDGTVVFATGPELHAWRADGSLATLATYDKPVAALALVDGKPLAITSDGVLHFGDRNLANVSVHASIAECGLVASTTPDGVLEVIDAVAGERWSLASPKGRTFGAVQISPDGRRVVATTDAGALVWTLDLPSDADATARWLADQTNAVARDADAPLDWR